MHITDCSYLFVFLEIRLIIMDDEPASEAIDGDVDSNDEGPDSMDLLMGEIEIPNKYSRILLWVRLLWNVMIVIGLGSFTAEKFRTGKFNILL